MKTKLGIVIAAVEIASITGLLFLLGRKGLPSNFAVSLVFLLPIAFGLHVMEEFIFPGGAEDWLKINQPQYAQAYTPSYLFKINAIPLALAALLTFGTFNFAGSFDFFGIHAWLVFLSFQAFNAVFHIRGTLKTKRYSPGLLVSISLYLPLTIVGFAYLLRTGAVDVVSAVVCFSIGTMLQPVLDCIKSLGLKKAGNQQSVPE